MLRSLLLAALLTSSSVSFAQVDSIAIRYAATITQTDLRTHLSVLASDAYEGRETGMNGQKMSAAYIEQQFKDLGIPPVPNAEAHGMLKDGYQQQYPLVLTQTGGLGIAVGGKPLTFMKDYFYYSDRLRKPLEVADLMVISPLMLGGAKLSNIGKVVMVLDPAENGNSILEDDDVFTQMKDISSLLAKTGTEVVLLVNQQATEMMREQSGRIITPRMRLGTAEELAAKNNGVQLVVITPEMAQAILDEAHMSMKKALKASVKKRLIVQAPMNFSYSPLDHELTGENVLGYVEGSDKKGELVAVTAHYDHLGIIGGEVYNGADDDGSGTAAVLEMAQAFTLAKAQGHGPRRSMLFMTVSGEEKGLFGSDWYTDHPVFPLDSTVADLNIDMIGRVDPEHEDSAAYVYVIGSGRISSELRKINEAQNAMYTKLQLDYTFDSDSDPNRFYYRSDHYNFAKHGVPIAFYFNGVHADYHGPHDEVDKIRFDLLEQRAKLVFHTAWELANREQRIMPDKREKLGHD